MFEHREVTGGQARIVGHVWKNDLSDCCWCCHFACLDSLTKNSFDDSYFKNFVDLKGLLYSGKQLYNNSSTASQVSTNRPNSMTCWISFVNPVVKMGTLGSSRVPCIEISTSCGKVNGC